MSTSTSAGNSVTRGDWRLILLASLGGALEFYDFVVYSQFAKYIASAFFPNTDPLVSLIFSFATFALGYLVRPLGGIFFSHIGDRIGRRKVLIMTILLMSGATVCIGLLPTYAQVGILAPILLLLLRVIQGFCLGGELPGAISYVVETAPRRSGFSVGVIFFCVNSGVLLAAILNLTLQATMTPEAIGEWGWRIGFLIGGVLGIFSFMLRLTLEESKEFTRIRSVGKASALPIRDLVKNFPAATLVGFAILAVTAGFNGLLFAMPAYLPATMGYTAFEASLGQNIGLAIISVGLLTVAWLSDRFPRKPMVLFGTGMIMLLSYAFFKAAQDHSANLYVMFALVGIIASFCNGTVIGICADLFPTHIRFTGVAMSFNLSFSLLSGLAPVAIAWLARETGNPADAAYYMIFCAAVSFVGALVMHKYDGQILKDLQAK
ncbi:MAG: MFS transporter [Pseudomonadota bacterium]